MAAMVGDAVCTRDNEVEHHTTVLYILVRDETQEKFPMALLTYYFSSTCYSTYIVLVVVYYIKVVPT